MSKKSNRSPASRKGVRLTKKEDPRFVYAVQPGSQYYRHRGVHEDFQCLVSSPEAAEAHKFLKAAAALEGVPMERLHKLSPSVKRKLKEVIGDNKELRVSECRYLMNSILRSFFVD